MRKPKLPVHLTKNLPPLTDILRGSLLRDFHEDCRCHPKGRYGPYWRLSVHCDGRTKMYQLKPHQVPKVRKAIANYRRWWKACLRIFEANTMRILAKED